MAQGSNSKGHPILSGAMVGIIAGVVSSGFTQWANRSGSNDDLVALRTEVTGMRKQLDRIESRDYVSRAEFDRSFTRLEDRLRDIERQLGAVPRQQDNNR